MPFFIRKAYLTYRALVQLSSFYEKSSVWASPELQLAPANSFSTSRKAGKGRLLTKVLFI